MNYLDFTALSCTLNAKDVKLENGILHLTSDNGNARVCFNNIEFSAKENIRVKMKIKADISEPIADNRFILHYTTDIDTEFHVHKTLPVWFKYPKPDGWYEVVFDVTQFRQWKSTITNIHIEFCDIEGEILVEYIGLVKADKYQDATHEQLLAEGFESTRLLLDEHFERGFYVPQFEQKENYLHGIWQDFCETDEKPLWQIAPWWCKYDLWDNRDKSLGKYTLADTYGINSVTYNPEEKYVSMRQNVTKILEGRPHIPSEYKWWPHLLIEQNSDFCDFDKVRNTANADRMFVEIDVRAADFKDTINPEGKNHPSFMIYFYLMTDKAPGIRIWFGLDLLLETTGDDRTNIIWHPDSAAHQFMYKIPPAVVFGCIENALNSKEGVVVTGKEWTKVRCDITSHIDRAVELANRDNAYGVPVTKEDLYFSGVNIGFEISGNYDCTIDFKNFNMISYKKD